MISQNDCEIQELVIRYINERNSNYAILIDGEWGCGKTYFVKEHLMHKIKKIPLRIDEKDVRKKPIYYKAIYLSLYGIKSTDEISSQLYISILSSPFEDPVNNRFVKWFKGAQPLVGAGLRIVADKLKLSPVLKIDIKGIMSPFTHLDKYIFLFDDLERCSINVNEILGYINYLVEQNHVKAIIIANESEIGQLKFCDNLEQKYLVAALDAKSENSRTTSSANTIIYGNEKNNPPSLRQRADVIFQSDEQYQKIKEKLIGKVVYYQPELSQILPNIIDKEVIAPKAREFVLSNSDRLLELLSNMHCHNLRTIEFALSCFTRIYEIDISDIIFSEYERTIWSDILLSCLYESIAYKAGKGKSDWGSAFYCRRQPDETKLISPLLTTFQFIEELVRYSSFNGEHIKFVIKLYADESKASLAIRDEDLEQLNNCWQQEDDLNESLLQAVLKKIDAGYYPANTFKSTLHLLYNLKHVGYSVDIDLAVEKMIGKIQNTGGYIEDHFLPISPPDEYKAAFQDNIVALNIASRNSQKANHSNHISAILGLEQNWGAELEKYVYENRNTFFVQKYFWAHVNPDIYTVALEKCTVKDFSSFRRSLGTVYEFSNLYDYFKADSQSLHLLLSYIESSNYKSKMKELHRGYLVEQLKEIIKSIDNEQ